MHYHRAMARRNGPALYELMGKRGGGGEGEPSTSRPPMFTSGQMQFATYAALVLTIAVVSYLFGVSRGEQLGREAVVAEREEERRLLDQARPSAPATQAPQVPVASGNPGAPQSPAAGMNGGAVPQPSPAGAATALGPQPEGVDPRQSGLLYFVLTTTRPDYAVPVVNFFRERGLDAWRVSIQNSRSGDVEVIVLPGFPEGERSSASVKDLESRIRRVGLLYKAAGRNNPDFADMVPKRHR